MSLPQTVTISLRSFVVFCFVDDIGFFVCLFIFDCLLFLLLFGWGEGLV